MFAFALDDSLQPLPLFFGRDLARDARMIHRRHEYQEASRQRDVTGDARALFPDRLLGNLDQHFLPFFEQFADLRHHLVLATAEAPSTAPSAAPVNIRGAVRTAVRGPIRTTVRTALRSATLRPLQQPRLGCG